MDGRATVLVVEHNEQHAKVLEEGIQSCSHSANVIVCPTVAAAETYLFDAAGSNSGKKPNPVFVMVDVTLPSEGGVQLLARIRRDARTRAVPVIMVGAQPAQADLDGLYRTGANSFLEKPESSAELAARAERTARYWLNLNLSPQRAKGLREAMHAATSGTSAN